MHTTQMYNKVGNGYGMMIPKENLALWLNLFQSVGHR